MKLRATICYLASFLLASFLASGIEEVCAQRGTTDIITPLSPVIGSSPLLDPLPNRDLSLQNEAKPFEMLASQPIQDPILRQSNSAPEVEYQPVQQTIITMDQVPLGPVLETPNIIHCSLEDVLHYGLQNSAQIRSLQFAVLEAKQIPGEELGNFDAQFFAEATFGDEAIGGQIINGTDPSSIGVRKATTFGGEFELRQAFNVAIGNAANQGNTQSGELLILRYSQNLLEQSGETVVLNRALVAYLDAQELSHETVAQIAEILEEISQAYWSVYVARVECMIRSQQKKLSEQLVQQLEQRSAIDAETNTIALAEQNVINREIQLKQARTNLIDQQNQLFRLMNYENDGTVELMTTDVLSLTTSGDRLELENVAVSTRPEIMQFLRQIEKRQLEIQAAANQGLPTLEVFVESQFSSNTNGSMPPQDRGFATGLNFEQSIRNRAPRSAKMRAQYAFEQARANLRDAMFQIILDVRTAVNQVNLSYELVAQNRDRVAAAKRQADYLRARIKVPRVDSGNFAFQIQQLFDAIDQAGDARFQMYEQAAQNQIAMFSLRRATGTVLTTQALYPDTMIPREKLLKNLKDSDHFEPLAIETLQHTLADIQQRMNYIPRHEIKKEIRREMRKQKKLPARQTAFGYPL